MMRRSWILVAGMAVLAVLAAGGFALGAVGFPAGRTTPGAAPRSSTLHGSALRSSGSAAARPVKDRSAQEIGRDFLRSWVQDGRVIRRDQGGDTVSEGQAYGMLIADGVGDEKQFSAIWDWTKKNLMRSDGLLAWQWSKGAVRDSEPAADADLDTARALVLAGTRFSRPEFTQAGTELATRIADHLTVETSLGRILLPGTWATPPYAYNPSYASPATFRLLQAATGDPRWSQLIDGSRAVTAQLLTSTALPPDWAQISADGVLHPMPGPRGQGQSVRYGYDAARLPIRYAESCNPEDVALAARLAPTLNRDNPLAVQLDLGGRALNNDQGAVAYAARAAARAAAGDLTGARADLKRSDRQAQKLPTYYGDAWAALAPLYLESNVLGGCPLLKPAPSKGH